MKQRIRFKNGVAFKLSDSDASYNIPIHIDEPILASARDMRYTISLDTDALQLTGGTGTKSIIITLQSVE